MRRSDRLSQIIEIVQDGRLHLARDIAERLAVSLRTIYRDFDTLAASGIPIDGERGVPEYFSQVSRSRRYGIDGSAESR